jgi:hypothetical protein
MWTNVRDNLRSRMSKSVHQLTYPPHRPPVATVRSTLSQVELACPGSRNRYWHTIQENILPDVPSEEYNSAIEVQKEINATRDNIFP